MAEQQEMLAAVNIAGIGFGEDLQSAAAPAYIELDGVVVAFIGFDDQADCYGAGDNRAGIFHVPPSAQLDPTLRAVIHTARERADLVVVTPHWGRNWTDSPTPARISLAHAMIDAGVDAILGHSAHAPHGIEIYRGWPIVYDMGNFLFDAICYIRGYYGLAIELSFDRDGFRQLAVHPTYNPGQQVRLGTGYAAAHVRELIRKQSKALGRIRFRTRGEALCAALNPEPRDDPAPRLPDRLRPAGGAQQLPDDLRWRRPIELPATAPDWTRDFEPVVMSSGLRVIGADFPENAVSTRGFACSAALKASGPLVGDWEALFEFRHRETNVVRRWWHPIANAATQPQTWAPGQIVVDRVYVRKQLEPGSYDVYWGLGETPLGPRNRRQAMRRNRPRPELVWVGEFELRRGAEPTVPTEPPPQTAALSSLIKPLAVATGIALLAVALYWRRRRNEKGSAQVFQSGTRRPN